MFANGNGLVRFGGRRQRLSGIKDCPHNRTCVTWEGCVQKSQRERQKRCGHENCGCSVEKTQAA